MKPYTYINISFQRICKRSKFRRGLHAPNVNRHFQAHISTKRNEKNKNTQATLHEHYAYINLIFIHFREAVARHSCRRQYFPDPCSLAGGPLAKRKRRKKYLISTTSKDVKRECFAFSSWRTRVLEKFESSLSMVDFGRFDWFELRIYTFK